MLKTVNNLRQVEQAVAVELTHRYNQLQHESVRSKPVGDEGSGGEHTEGTIDSGSDRFHGDHKGVRSGKNVENKNIRAYYLTREIISFHPSPILKEHFMMLGK